MSTPPPRYISKILLLGDSFVGKSCLIQRYVKNEFMQEFKATIGCDFLMKQVVTSEGENVTMQIWDTAGQERFQCLGHAFYRGSDGLALVFDLTNADSFAHLDSWLDSFNEIAGEGPDFPVVLIGNKVDKASERRVTENEAKNWSETHPGVQYYECSAKEGTGVEAAFMNLCLAMRNRDRAKPIVLTGSNIRIQKDKGKDGKKQIKCCKR